MDTPILDTLIFYFLAMITLIGLPVLVAGQLWTNLTPWAGVLAGASTLYLAGFCWARALNQPQETTNEYADIIDLNPYTTGEVKNVA